MENIAKNTMDLADIVGAKATTDMDSLLAAS